MRRRATLGHADGAGDGGVADIEAAARLVIEGREDDLGPLLRGGRAGDRHAIAARGDNDAEILLYAREVAIVFAEELAEQAVVVEVQQQRRACCDLGRGPARGGGFQSASRPVRLFGLAATTSTAATEPSRPAGASTWTACM